MENNGKIYKAIPAIMDEIGHIGKDKRNQQQGFMFRGVDQVMNTMKPLLAKHGVFVLPVVTKTTREERLTKSGGTLIYTMHIVDFHFIADDGSEVVATIVGEGMDSADKSSNKAMAVAFKYACFQVFCIPTEDLANDDPDNYVPEASKVSEAQLLTYIGNCESKEDLKDLATMYEANIKSNPKVMAAYQAKKTEVCHA